MDKIDFYSTEIDDGRTWLFAAAFGLGPRIAAETLARQLGWPLIHWQPNRLPVTSTTPHLLINFGVVGPAAHQPATYRIWIDCLMWLRRIPPPGIQGYDLILAESFFPTRADLRRFGPRIVDIEPLYEPSSAACIQNDSGPVLVSFGGIHTPHSTSVHRIHFQARILQVLARVIQHALTERPLICCVPADVASELQERLPDVAVFSPERSQFIALLETASLYIVQPGLYGPFEAFATRTPSAFMPPFSYTQLGQAMRYQERGLLGPTALMPELLTAAGPLEFVFGEEQKQCFKRLEAWFVERGDTVEFGRQVTDWARSSIENGVPNEITEERRRLVDDSRRYPAAAQVITDYQEKTS